jgi:DNA-binding NarL/FixJ family response regulator
VSDLNQAKALLRQRLAGASDPAAAFELAILEHISGELEAARDRAETVFRRWRAEGKRREAARVARFLGNLMHDGFGNLPAARGWLARGRRLLEGEGPCLELGWLELGVAGCNVADAADLAQRAKRALEIAQQFDNADLECRALADLGLALVSMGRVAEGMTRLDESLTLIADREVVNPEVIGQATCCLVSACERCGDLAPVEAWSSVVGRPSADDEPRFVFSHCHVTFGRILCEAGRWAQAETALRLGIGAAALAGSPRLRAVSQAALADLRIRQGRLEEARQLLEGSEDRVETAPARALLHLARREPELAAAVARQALRELNADCLRAGPLRLLLVDAELQQGDLTAATAAAEQLDAIAAETALPMLQALAALARGRVLARSDPGAAPATLERGLLALATGDWPLLRAALHRDLARALAPLDPAAAVAEARSALAIYERVGAPEAEDVAALLRGLGVAVHGRASPDRPGEVLSAREREVLVELGRGKSNPEIAETLVVSRKTVEHHVTSILTKLGLRSRAEAAVYAVTESNLK